MSTSTNVVAGNSGGKRVICISEDQHKYNALKQLSLQGNHWARIAVQQLHGLCTGRIGKDNIYITPNENRRPGSHGHDEFFIILPGCKATIERKANDEYHIILLEVDASYGELQAAEQRPGMYYAKRDETGEWNADYSADGSLSTLANQMPVVGVSDSGYGSPADAALNTSPEIKKYLQGGAGPFFEKNGFNMHFTPGEKRIGGLRNFRDATAPLKNQKTLESAQLLAKSMYDARHIEGVLWISEFGGSGVLTQAMEMLGSMGIKLEKHTAFMVRPSTDTNAAMNAALNLGLKLDRQLSMSKSGDLMGTRGNWAAINTRRNLDGRNYSLAQASWDRFKHLKTLHGAAATGIAVGLGGLGLAGVAAVSPLTLIPQSVAPVVLGICKTLGVLGGGVKAADKIGEAVAPKLHNRVTGKFK